MQLSTDRPRRRCSTPGTSPRRRHLRRAHEAEAEPLGVGHVPDAGRQLRVAFLPDRVRLVADGAVHACGRVVPRAAAHRDRVRRRRLGPGLVAAAGWIRHVLIDGPLHDVAEHVVQAPRVGLLRPELVVGAVGELAGRRVLLVPGHVRQLRFGHGRRTAGAAGVLPLGLGGHAVVLTGPRTEPLGVLVGGVRRHADRREAAVAAAEAHLEVRRGRAAQRVDEGVGLRPSRWPGRRT